MWRWIGLLMMTVAPIAPTLLWVYGDELVVALSGNDPTPNQNAMVIVFGSFCTAILAGLFLLTIGCVLLIRNSPRGVIR